MSATYPLKNLPAPLQALIRPMLLISLAVHGLLLLAPMPEEEKVESAPKKEKSVKVTQLAAPSKNPPARTQEKSTPAPEKPKAATPNELAKPAPKVTPITSRPVQPPPRPQPVIQAPPPARPKPVAPSPPPPKQAAPNPSSTPEASPNPTSEASPSPTPEASPSPSPTPEASPSPPPPDFPHYPGVKQGCLEVTVPCFNTGNDLAKVAAHFEKELVVSGYQQAPAEIDEPGSRKVYRLSKSGSEFDGQYLSVLSTKDGAIYVLAPEARTLDELKTAVGVPSEFYTILADVGEDMEDETSFANPSDFFSKLSSQDAEGSLLPAEQKEEIQGMKLLPGETPGAAYIRLLPSLQGIFEVSESGNYGGGKLYQIKKGSFTGFLNLVPTKDGTGTIVVVWNEQPA